MNDLIFLFMKNSDSIQNKYLNSNFKSLKNEYVSHDFIQELNSNINEQKQQKIFIINRYADLFIIELIKIPIEYNLCDLKCLIIEIGGYIIYIPFNIVMLVSDITQTTKYNIIKLPQELVFVDNLIKIPLVALQFHEVKIIIKSKNIFSCSIYGKYTYLSGDHRAHIAQKPHIINIKSYCRKHSLNNETTYYAGNRLFGLFIKYCGAMDDDLNIKLVDSKNPNNIIVLHGEKIQPSWIIIDNKQYNNHFFKPIKHTTTNHNNFKEYTDNIYWYPREQNKKWYEQSDIGIEYDIEYDIVFSKPLCCTLYLVKNNQLGIMSGMSCIMYI